MKQSVVRVRAVVSLELDMQKIIHVFSSLPHVAQTGLVDVLQSVRVDHRGRRQKHRRSHGRSKKEQKARKQRLRCLGGRLRRKLQWTHRDSTLAAATLCTVPSIPSHKRGNNAPIALPISSASVVVPFVLFRRRLSPAHQQCSFVGRPYPPFHPPSIRKVLESPPSPASPRTNKSSGRRRRLLVRSGHERW
jgi:hypothetical protein